MTPQRQLHRPFSGPVTAGIFLTGMLHGCGPSRPADVQTQLRDSAGITIVESSGFPERGAGGWILEQTPSLSIGTLEGDTLYQLYEISDGIRLGDGRIVLSDNGNNQLRVFGADGTFIRSLGREGEGPGEFKSVRVMGTVGADTLVVLDAAQRRISFFHPEAGFLRQETIQEEVGVTYFSNGMFSDGAIVFGGGIAFGPGGDIPSDGIHRRNTSYQSVGPDGKIRTDFGEMPGAEMFMKSQRGSGEFMISASPIHFGRRPSAVARGDRLVLGSGDTFEARMVRPNGEVDRILRVLAPPVEVTWRDLDGLLEERIAGLDDPAQEPETRSGFGEIPHADLMPAYQGFLLDSEGFLWVETLRRPGEGLRSWIIFDGEGIPRSRLSLPRDNRILDIGADFVLSLFEDPLGVEYVRLYPLVRGS